MNNDEEPVEWTSNPFTLRRYWDDYVYTTVPDPPELVTSRTYLSAGFDRATYDDHRHRCHANWAVQETDSLTAFFKAADDRVRSNRYAKRQSKRALAAIGVPTSGKTTILTSYGKRHQQRRKPDPDQNERIPVIYVVVPSEPYGRGLPMAIARFMNHPLAHVKSGTNTWYRNQVLDAMRDFSVELLLIDEATNLWPSTTPGIAATKAVRTLMEDFGGTVLFAGANLENTGMLSGDYSDTLSGRVATETCHAYDRTTPNGQSEWKGFLTNIEEDIRLLHHKPETLAAMEKYIWDRTRGLPASVTGLITDACGRAMDDYLAYHTGSDAERERFTKAPREEITKDLLAAIPVNHYTDTAPEREKRAEAKKQKDARAEKQRGIRAAVKGRAAA